MAQVFAMDWSQFTSGRLTSDLGLRQGIDVYKAAALDADNYICSAQGPLHKRPGFELIDRQDDAVAIMPFNFSQVQAYAMVFCSDGNLRVYLVDTPGSPVATLAHPYSSGDLPEVKFTQSFDTMFLFHPDYPEQRLIRGGSHSSWSFSPIPWGTGQFPPQYRFTDTAGITLTASAWGGAATTDTSITLTASAALFDSTWIDIWLRMGGGYVKITSVTDSTHAAGLIPVSDLFFPGASGGNARSDRYSIKYQGSYTDWTEQATSARRGYARAGAFHQGRLTFGGTRDLPQTLMLSRTNSFYDFNPNFDVVVESGTLVQDDVHDDDSISYTLNSQQSHVIENVFSSAGALQIFTREGEWVEQSVPISPKSVGIVQTSTEGTIEDAPQILATQGYSIFVDKTGMSAFTYSYQYQGQSYLPNNVSIISNHDMLTSPNSNGMIKNMLGTGGSMAIFCNGRDSTDNFGRIITLTFDPANKALGWSRWTSDLFDFIYFAEVANRIYVAMKRKSDDAVFIGYLSTARVDHQKYLDLALTQTLGSPGTSFTGFSTFAGTTVTVRADDYYVYSGIVVDGSGNFTLPDARTSVIVGYPYPDRFESMPVAPIINGQLQRGGKITLKRTTVWAQNAPAVIINGRTVRPRSIPAVRQGLPYTVEFNRIYEFESSHHTDGTEPTTVVTSMQGFPCSISGVKVDFQIGRST